MILLKYRWLSNVRRKIISIYINLVLEISYFLFISIPLAFFSSSTSSFAFIFAYIEPLFLSLYASCYTSSYMYHIKSYIEAKLRCTCTADDDGEKNRGIPRGWLCSFWLLYPWWKCVGAVSPRAAQAVSSSLLSSPFPIFHSTPELVVPAVSRRRLQPSRLVPQALRGTAYSITAASNNRQIYMPLK